MVCSGQCKTPRFCDGASYVHEFNVISFMVEFLLPENIISYCPLVRGLLFIMNSPFLNAAKCCRGFGSVTVSDIESCRWMPAKKVLQLEMNVTYVHLSLPKLRTHH